MGNRITRTVLFAASALLSMSAFGAGAARFGTLRNSDWVVTNAWQAVSNKTHDLIVEIGGDSSLPPNWSNVSNAAMNAVSKENFATATNDIYGALSDIKTDSITDGTNTIDAAGNVFRSGLSPWYAKSLPIGEGHTNYIPYLILEYKTIQVVGEADKEGWLSNVPYQNVDAYGDIYFFLTSDLRSAEYLVKDGNNYSVITGDDIFMSTSTNITQIGIEGCYIFRDTVYRNIIVGKIALTNDIPPAIQVVSPSTNAVAGTAADAKATGTALYTGFTEWTTSPPESSVRWLEIGDTVVGWVISYESVEVAATGGTDPNATSISANINRTLCTATRHLVTPTKTSQLSNDGSNGVPFAVVTQIPAPVDIETKVSTNALSGKIYDFSRNYDIIKATADLIRILGGTVTNNPTGGN